MIFEQISLGFLHLPVQILSGSQQFTSDSDLHPVYESRSAGSSVHAPFLG